MCCEQGNKGFASEELGAGGRRKSRKIEGFDPNRDFSTGKFKGSSNASFLKKFRKNQFSGIIGAPYF